MAGFSACVLRWVYLGHRMTTIDDVRAAMQAVKSAPALLKPARAEAMMETFLAYLEAEKREREMLKAIVQSLLKRGTQDGGSQETKN